MQKSAKKMAAALAAVELLLQQERDDAASQLSSAAQFNVSTEPTQWSQSGRLEMMSTHRMLQMRAISSGR